MPTTLQTDLDQVLLLGGFLQSHAEFWLWLTLVLLIAEIFTAGFFLAALAVSTVFTAAGAWLGLGAEWQVAFFALCSIGSMMWLRPVFLNLLSPGEVATNTDALLGQRGTVVAQVPAGGVGRVRLSNEEWRATAEADLDVGAPVRVTGVRGNTLTVGPA